MKHAYEKEQLFDVKQRDGIFFAEQLGDNTAEILQTKSAKERVRSTTLNG